MVRVSNMSGRPAMNLLIRWVRIFPLKAGLYQKIDRQGKFNIRRNIYGYEHPAGTLVCAATSADII